jgi:hypothetical protein
MWYENHIPSIIAKAKKYSKTECHSSKPLCQRLPRNPSESPLTLEGTHGPSQTAQGTSLETLGLQLRTQRRTRPTTHSPLLQFRLLDGSPQFSPGALGYPQIFEPAQVAE